MQAHQDIGRPAGSGEVSGRPGKAGEASFLRRRGFLRAGLAGLGGAAAASLLPVGLASASPTMVVAVSNVSISYGTPSATLTATVTANGKPLTKGKVSFTVSGVGSGLLVPVVNGTATATMAIPVTTPPGSRQITAVLHAASFFGSASGTGTLTIGPANLTLKAVNESVATGATSVNLSATVFTPTGARLNQGDVAFQIWNLTTEHPVAPGVLAAISRGVASTAYSLPANLPAGTYTIYASTRVNPAEYYPATATATLTVTGVPA